jgi:hypothetical protein
MHPIEELLKKLKKESGDSISIEHHCISGKFDDDRTVENIKSHMLTKFANKKYFTGDHEYHGGLQKLIVATVKDSEFDQALTTVAEKLLKLFPVTKKDKKKED